VYYLIDAPAINNVTRIHLDITIFAMPTHTHISLCMGVSIYINFKSKRRVFAPSCRFVREAESARSAKSNIYNIE